MNMKLGQKKVRRYPTIVISLVLAVVLASYTFCKREGKEQILVQLIPQALSVIHFNPMEINDTFSARVYKLYIKHLDYSRRFLTKEDIKELEPYKLAIDDEIKSQNTDFYYKANAIFDKAVTRAEKLYLEILAKPFDFTADDSYQTDPDKADFAENDAALRIQWTKALKYETLTRLNDMVEAQNQGIESAKSSSKMLVKTKSGADSVTSESAIKDTVKKKTFAEMEIDARAKVLKFYNERFKRLKNTSETEDFSVFLNAITGVYDPHTAYLNPSDKENFEIGMSGQLEGIGAQLQESDGYVKVVSLVPGSPSWRQGELKVNDLILKVAQGDAEPVDVVDMRLNDVVKLVRGKKGTVVKLTVKKIDGSIKKITIVRDVVITEETYAKSAVIEEKNSKIGYLYLPKFYANFDNKATGRSCADDVAIEIEKLKKDGVSSLIFDLRNNGGGSLPDVVRMAGLFIGTGPIVQVKTKDGDPKIYRDFDPQIKFNGPMVMLVNEFSASASEILASAMQDYRRAIIMGSNSFGKGTVQTQVNLNDLVEGDLAKSGPLGGMLITIQKFYRINGGSTQMKGVTPDIVVPDAYSLLNYGERDEDYCMPWSKVNAASYAQWTGISNFADVTAKAQANINTSEDFKIIKEQAAEFKKQKDETVVSLNFEKFKSEEKVSHDQAKKFEAIGKKDYGLKIRPLDADVKNESDTSKVTRLNTWTGDLKKDIYLREAVRVVEMIK